MALNVALNIVIFCSILCLIWSSCTPEMVKADIEPFVNFVVKFEILVANLLWRQSLFQCFRLGCRTVLVGSADVQRVVISCFDKK